MLRKRRMLTIFAIISALIIIIAAAIIVALSRMEPEFVGVVEKQIEVFDKDFEPKVDAKVDFLWFTIDLKVEKIGEVDNKTLGVYPLRYTTRYFWKTFSSETKVTVVDSTAPNIITEEENVVVNFISYPITVDDVNVVFSATDNYDGDLTDKVEKTIEENICLLTVRDSSGNTTTKEINLVFDDGIRPVLVLKGPSTVYLPAGAKYSEVGYAATDNLDGEITSNVIVDGNVDNQNSGTYILEYKVTDSSGNSAKLARKVIVYGSATADSFTEVNPNGKTVYLTFDDGPGAHTQRLLDILDQYNVKATFFVTNQFSNYQYLIGAAYSKGHKIAVHTYSHQIYKKENNIYSSVENYINDFNSMQNIIEAQTGSTTNIFRFPGGTNNTISKNYCTGIMTELVKQMTEAGYIYFDWNVDSYDAQSSSNTQKIISQTINQINAKENAVVLMHDIHKKTVDAVPAIIEYCLENGYKFEVLSEVSPSIKTEPQN